MKIPLSPLLVLVLSPALLRAADLTYDGGAGGSWQNGGAGWLDGGSPAAWNNATPDAATFTGAAPTSVSIDSGGVTAGNITITSGSYSFGGPGTLTLSGAAWSVGAGLTNTVSAALAGTTGLTKTGDGVLAMAETNKVFTGGTVINGGAVLITNTSAGSLGASNTAPVSLNGGALYAQFATNLTMNFSLTVGAAGGELRNIGLDATNGRLTMAANRLSGSGALTLSFSTNQTRIILGGTTNATQTNFTGKWVVNGGSNVRFVDLYAGINFGNVSGDDAVTLQNGANLLLRAGTYQTNAGGADFGITLGSGGGRFNSSGNSTIVMANKISGAASNTLTLGVENGSILVLSNTANSYAGDTTIVANSGGTNGIVRLGTAGVIPDTGGTLSVGASTFLDLNGFSETVGALAGAGTVDNRAASNTATLTAGGSGASTAFSGAMVNTGDGAALALVKTGAGTLTITGTNSAYSGGTTVRSGRLVAAHTNALGTGNVLLQGDTAGGSNRATLVLSNVTMAGKTLTMDSTTNRAILLSASAGGATWSGDIILTGGTSTNGNTEIANDTGNGPLTVAGTITGAITNSGVLNLRGTGTTNTLSASVNIGTTPLNKIDTGAWIVTASGNQTGTVSVGGGRLELQGLTLVDGNVRTETTNPVTLTFSVAGGLSYGRFNQTGSAVLTNPNTTIAVRFLGGYEPTNSETYQIFAGALTGNPALDLPALSATNLAWVTNALLSAGQLTVTNLSAPTNAYAQWLTNYPGLSGTNAAGSADPDGDGFVNNLEFSFDGDPTVGSPSLVQGGKGGTNGVFSFVGRMSGTDYAVLSTTNLAAGPWTTNTNATASITVSTNQSGVLLPADYERKQFTVPLHAREFFRVQAVTAD